MQRMGRLYSLLGAMFLIGCLSFALCSSASVHIVGGSEAKPHSRPYMASIQKDGKHFCGGFLVAEQWVLTAAHCKEENSVVLGAHSLSKKESTKQVFGIAAAYRHPNATPHSAKHDIALFKLSRPAELTSAVKTIAFRRNREDVPAKVEVSVAGWGFRENNGSTDVLREVYLNVLNREECATLCKKNKFDVTEDMMCTLKCDMNGKKCSDACRGDSGGPLIYKDEAVGIVSWGADPCGQNIPGVYIVISHYARWIDSIMAKE